MTISYAKSLRRSLAEYLYCHGIVPTDANIEALFEANRKAAEEESKYCHECGRDYDD